LFKSAEHLAVNLDDVHLFTDGAEPQTGSRSDATLEAARISEASAPQYAEGNGPQTQSRPQTHERIESRRAG
jgi:hypothetical protein